MPIKNITMVNSGIKKKPCQNKNGFVKIID